MFFPEVTNIRSPTILAPVVRPTSCLIEPRYSTFGDMTASGSAGAAAAGAAATSRNSGGRRAVRIRILRSANAVYPQNLRHDLRSGRTRRGRRGRRRVDRGARDRPGG